MFLSVDSKKVLINMVVYTALMVKWLLLIWVFLMLVFSAFAHGEDVADSSLDNANGANVAAAGTQNAERDLKTAVKPALEDCAEELLESRPTLTNVEAASICKAREYKELRTENKLSKVKALEKDDFIELREDQLLASSEECETEACRIRIQERVKKLIALDERYGIKLKAIEEKRLEVLHKLEDMREEDIFSELKTRDFKARALDKIKQERARENFLAAKEHFLEAQERYREALIKFEDSKKELVECTEACEELEDETLLHAKTYALNAADAILTHLNKLKHKISESEHLTEEQAKDMTWAIDAKIKDIEDAKLKIEQATTKEEFLEAVKVINATWKRTKVEYREHELKLKNARFAGVLLRAVKLEAKLQKVLERMTENGKDITQIEPLTERFNKKIEEARALHSEAIAGFNEFKDTKDVDKAKEAVGKLMDAQEKIKEAHDILKDITDIIKDKGKEEIEDVDMEETSEDITEIREDLEKLLTRATDAGLTINDEEVNEIKGLLDHAEDAFNAGKFKEAEKLAEQADELLDELEDKVEDLTEDEDMADEETEEDLEEEAEEE